MQGIALLATDPEAVMISITSTKGDTDVETLTYRAILCSVGSAETPGH